MTQQQARLTYRALLTDPRITSIIAAVTIGRLAAGMVPFGMIAVFTSQRELGLAGASFTAFLLGAAVSGPYKGAMIDRFGARRLLVPMAFAFTAAAAGAAALAVSGHPQLLPTTLVVIVFAAVVAPPNSAVLRTVWTEIARDSDENTRLHSLDSVIEEGTFVVAPLLTSGIWLVSGAHWAVVAGGLCALVGTVWFQHNINLLGANRVIQGSRPAGKRSGTRGPGVLRLLLSRNGIAVLIPMAALGIAMGALSVGFPAWALERFYVEFAGVLMALASIGGIMAGLIYGRLPTRQPLMWQRYFCAVVLLASGVALVAISTNVPMVVLGSLLVGAALTPMYIIAFVLVGTAFPKSRHTTVNASVSSIYNLASGLAAAVFGAVLAMTWPLTGTLLALAVLAIALGATALLGRSTNTSAEEATDTPDTEHDEANVA